MKHLNKYLTILFLLLFVGTFSLIDADENKFMQQIDRDWVLDWEENFDRPCLDTAVWSKIPRGTALWKNTMSSDSSCYDFRDGCIVLKGIVNKSFDKDTSRYLTGGIYTKFKKALQPGRIVIRAKLNSARGAWPAIWLVPYETNKPWLWEGEIDIMEHFHHKPFIVQTIHSHYTRDVDSEYPKNKVKVPIEFKQFNEYGVDILEDSIVFHVNGMKTLCYQKLSDYSDNKQFPFYHNWTLLIDMQLGGGNVGKINDSELPVEMEIDWVRHYKKL
jgi:hypothetical protein